jgi:hypothetical protein
LQPVFVLPLEHDAPVAALRLCTGTGGPSADDLAWQLANSACTRAEVGVLDLGLEAALGGAAAVVPLVSGRDLLGRWIRALHQEVKAVNGNSRMPRVQARLGLHGQASKTDEVTDSNVAAAFANCETAHAMLGIRAAALVIVASDEFHDLVVDRIVRFPAASAYRPFTMDRVSGRRCWLAVAGHSVCPELPLSMPSSAESTADDPDASIGSRFSLRDNYGSIVNQAPGSKLKLHVGNVYVRKGRRR